MAFLNLSDHLATDGVPVRSADQPFILIFTEGTILGPRHWWEWFNDKGYTPIGLSVQKVRAWAEQGAQIVYLTSRQKAADVWAIRDILKRAGFPGEALFYRAKGQSYRDIAEQLCPAVLIEDDCRSIGGSWQMTITHVKPDIKQKIHSLVVPEFRGIDALPDNLTALLTHKIK